MDIYDHLGISGI